MRTTDYEGHLITVWARVEDGGRWIGVHAMGGGAWGQERETPETHPTEAEAEEAALVDAKRMVDIMRLG